MRTATGLRAWVLQRVTAVYLALFLVYVVAHFALDPPRDYAAWRDWVGDPLVSVATLLFFATLLLHAWVGLRDIVIDYVHPVAIRVTVLAVLATGLAACALWAAQVLFLARW